MLDFVYNSLKPILALLCFDHTDVMEKSAKISFICQICLQKFKNVVKNVKGE